MWFLRLILKGPALTSPVLTSIPLLPLTTMSSLTSIPSLPLTVKLPLISTSPSSNIFPPKALEADLRVNLPLAISKEADPVAAEF